MYIIILMLCFILSIGTLFFYKRGKKVLISLTLINAVLIGGHMFFWGFRVNLIPSYLLISAAIVISVYHLVRKPKIERAKKSFVKSIMIGGGIVTLVLVSLIGIYLFPNFKLPEPTGNYAVGTMSLELMDVNREEPCTQDNSDHRKLMIQIWYPAYAGNEGEIQTYPVQVAEALNSVLKVPDWLFGYFSNIRTHTFLDAKILPLDEKYPIIVFSPGNNSTRFQNMAVVEELVSSGYVVIGVDHPYTSNDVLFTDGSTAYRSEGHLDVESQIDFYEKEIDIRAEDLQYVMHYLREGQLTEKVAEIVKQIDFDRIGMLGHSYGGATIVEAMAREPYVKVGVSYDGGLWGRAVEEGITQPLLYMSASQTLDYMNDTSAAKAETHSFVTSVFENLEKLQEKSSDNFLFVLFEGYNHYSFTDIPLISPLFQSKNETVMTTIQYTKAFFDRYLKDTESPTIQELVNRQARIHLIKDLHNLDAELYYEMINTHL